MFQSAKRRDNPQKRSKRANIYKIRATNLYFEMRSVIVWYQRKHKEEERNGQRAVYR